MWFGYRLPVAVVSQAYPGNAEICPGFPPPQAALCIILSNEGDAVYLDRYNDRSVAQMAVSFFWISFQIFARDWMVEKR